MESTARTRPATRASMDRGTATRVATESLAAAKTRCPAGRLTPYVSAGIGAAVPRVDVETAGGKTFEYRLTGSAVKWKAGTPLAISDRCALFAQYNGSHSWNRADLQSGGTLETDLLTHAIDLGLGYVF